MDSLAFETQHEVSEIKEVSNECGLMAVSTAHSVLALTDEFITIPFLRWYSRPGIVQTVNGL